MIYIGVDPGSTRSGIAAVGGGKVLAVRVATGCDEEHECGCLPEVVDEFFAAQPLVGQPFRFAVESQEYRHMQSKGSPDGLFKVAHAAGAAFAALSQMGTCEHGRFVKPTEWKGTVPKLQHHRRMLTKLGWEWRETETKEPYVVPTVMRDGPTGTPGIKPIEWSEVLDAIGIALWLEEKNRGR